MSDFRPPYNTTSGDRRRKRTGMETKTEIRPENTKMSNEDAKLPVSVPGRQISTETETVNICDACQMPTGPAVATAICRLCSHCVCSKCVDLLPSTFADIEKSDCLFFFCNNCTDLVATRIRSPPETLTVAQSTPSVVSPKTDQTTEAEVTSKVQSPLNICQPPSGSNNEISADMVNNIVKALESLQEKVCSIEDSIASSNGKNITATRSKPSLTKKAYADVARDPLAPPPIVLYQPESTSSAIPNQRQNKVSLEGRQLLPRPNTAPELLEEREKERRKYNVVIQNLPESDSTTADDRKAYDTMEAMCMLAAMRLPKIEVKSAVRIGKKVEDKIRPLMITLDSDRDPVIKRARFIRRYKDWQKVFIDPDRTPLEQEKFKNTRAEFKRRKESGENIIMRDGKILPSSRRASNIDLDTLVSRAEERVSTEKPAEKTSSVNLINLVDSVSNIQTHSLAKEDEPTPGTSSSGNTPKEQDATPQNEETHEQNENAGNSDQ